MNGTYALIRKYLPDLIYGANDGIVTTLAVIAGVVGASLSNQVILILGFANLFADGFSMGASNVLARRSETDGHTPTLLVATQHGVATFVGFLVAGFVPLIAYLVPGITVDRFQLTVFMALSALFAVGASRAFFTSRGFFRAGLEMLFIGTLASGLAYLVGVVVSRLTGVGI